MTTTVYTRPGCIQCDRTKKMMTALGIEFDVIDVEEHPEAATDLKSRGFQQLPVVLNDLAPWSGYQPEFIQQLAKEQANA